MINRFLIFLGIILISNFILAQNLGLVYDKATHFQIVNNNDSIDFIVIDKDFKTKKPVFLYCQGSQPKPLFIRLKDGRVFMFGGGISNFDINKIKEQYHLVVISMPKTPLYAPKNHLNENWNYVPDTMHKSRLSMAFMRADYIENYVERANSVIDYLKKQLWVDNSKLVVVGHSQGAKIATLLTSQNKSITHLGLFSANMYGRIDQRIREQRAFAESGKKTWEQAIEGMNHYYEFWKLANNADTLKKYPQFIAWKSFSDPMIDELVSISIPIYLTYGTEDITADLCDLVPLEFIKNHKNNLTVKRHIGLEHNFFEKSNNGRVDRSKKHWPEVMNAFVEWTIEKD